MNIVKVQLNNFQCFKKEEFLLPQENGLYLITGTNNHQPASGANGIGKSTVMDAIVWCLYGKTSSGRKAGKLLNYRTKASGYSVSLLFDDGTTLERKWNPNGLLLNSNEVPQEQVDKFVRLTYDQFLQTVYFAQQHLNSFIDLTANDKLNFLSQIFELNKWIEYADYAKGRAATLGIELRDLTYKKDLSVNNLAKEMDNLTGLEQSERDWAGKKATELQEKLTLLGQLYEDLDKLKPVANDKALADLMQNLKEEGSISATLKFSYQDAVKLTAEHKNSISLETREIENIKAEIKKLESNPSNCPLCKQALACVEMSDAILEFGNKIPPLVEKIAKATIDYDKCSKAQLGLDEDIKKSQDKLMFWEKEKSKVEAEVKGQETLINEKKKHLASVEGEIERKEKEENPYTKQMALLSEKIFNLDSEIANTTAKITELDVSVANYTYWQKTFPAIRLKILNNVIEELEFHFNQSLASIGYFNWQMQLETERELKNDTVKPELVLKLVENGKEIDVDSLSGGEKQRIRMIISIGLSTLIKQRVGLSCNLLMLDEPMQALAVEGIELILDMLVNLSQTNIILMAEHRVLELARFSGTYMLTKNEDGNTTICNPKQLSYSNPCLTKTTVNA